ncbi:MAG: hypothetical protein ACREGR_03725 [Minisyncoccia bacterium]
MSTKKKPERYLGEPAFIIRDNGEILRTAVSEIDCIRVRHLEPESANKRKGAEYRYQLLNGSSNRHFFDFEGALEVSEKALKEVVRNKNATKAESKAAEKYLGRLRTEKLRQEILSQPLIEGAMLGGFISARTLGKNETFPTNYFRPGQTVFALITPSTHYRTTTPWRPRPYFVLKTQVDKVSYGPRWPGKVYYNLGTEYSIQGNHLYATESEAREKLTEIFAQQTGGTIKPEKIVCIPASVEMQVNRKLMEDLFKSRGL